MLAMLLIVALQASQAPITPDLAKPPKLINSDGLITFQDYPTESLRRNEYGIVSVNLRVSANGKVTSCEVTESSGHNLLDEKTCLLLKSRARFEPAHDATGIAVEGNYRTANIWGIDQNQPKTTAAMTLQVRLLPPDYRDPVSTKLVFEATGRVSSCEIAKTSGSPSADQTACDYLKRNLTIDAPASAANEITAAAIRYVVVSLIADGSPIK